eukprot:363671-Chlamydomonas_euryale.AAC.3
MPPQVAAQTQLEAIFLGGCEGSICRGFDASAVKDSLGRSKAFTGHGYAQRIPKVATAVDCHATTVERKLQEPHIKRFDNSRNARVRVAEVDLATTGLAVGQTLGHAPPHTHSRS